jgi:branched-chain amino acid transport system substrate-binding protein
MNSWTPRLAAVLLCVLPVAGPAAAAAEKSTVKLGVVGPFTGPFAVMGEQWRQGIETYLAVHGDIVNGRKIEVIYRDTTGNPATAKQLTQELVTREKVQFLGGYGLTPEANASASIINSGKIPTFLFHVASPSSMPLSPYFVRVGQNIATNGAVSAQWALKAGKTKAYIAIADYGPGHDFAKGFREYYTSHGGEIVREDAIPLNTVDFSPFAERIDAAAPQYLAMFIPPGAPAVSMVKALAARGILTKTLVVGQGEAEDPDIHLFDGAILNFHSVIYYSSTLDTSENKKFVGTLKVKFGQQALPSTFTLGGYDGMALLFKAVSEGEGDTTDSDKVMRSLVGYTYASPRGQVTIAPSRELVEDFIVRRVEKAGEGLRNVVIDTIPQVDPATFK